jgi:hypothetical protein
MNIVGVAKTDIFSPCVFNNIVGLAFIFYFPFFLLPCRAGFSNLFLFSNIDFSEISVIHR